VINAFGDKTIKAYVNNMRKPLSFYRFIALSFYRFIISLREAHLTFNFGIFVEKLGV